MLDRPLNRGRLEVSESAFALLLAETVSYFQGRSQSVGAIHDKLAALGFQVGIKFYEVALWRERGSRRELRVVPLLQALVSVMWKALFGKAAELERSRDNDYLITDKEPLFNKYIGQNVRDKGGLNIAAYAAGMVKGALHAADFPAEVTAHFVEVDPTRLVTKLLIQFAPGVLERDAAQPASRT